MKKLVSLIIAMSIFFSINCAIFATNVSYMADFESADAKFGNSTTYSGTKNTAGDYSDFVKPEWVADGGKENSTVAIRGDEHIARHGQHALIAVQLAVVVAVGVPVRLDAAAEAHLDRVLMARHEPTRRGRAPVVRDLGLAAVDDALPEDAQLVAQRIARGGDALGGEAVHIARGEAAEAAVAEAGVRLGARRALSSALCS